jgi:hypothetical protein
MSIVLLRKLTRKSLIKFGSFEDLTVQNLIDTNKHKELLRIYYKCRNIDFAEDVLKELHITGDRVIDKKNKSEERYIKNSNLIISNCLKDIINNRTDHQNKIAMGQMLKSKKYALIERRNRERVFKSTLFSKGSESARVRRNYNKGNL